MNRSGLSILFYLLLIGTLSFNSKTYSQDTVYVDRLIDSAQFNKVKNWLYSKSLTLEALKISVDSNYTTRQINALNLLGYIYYINLHKYDSSYQYIYKAFELSEANNYKKGICEHYVLKGIFNKYTGNFAQAKIYFSKALQLAGQIDDMRLIANSRFSLAQIFITEGLYSIALKNVNSAIENYQLSKSKYGEAESTYLKGLLFKKMGIMDSCMIYINRTKGIYEELDDIVCIMECEYEVALMLMQKNEYNNAIQILNKCEKLKPDNYRANYLRYNAMFMLSEIYGRLRVYDKAYTYLKKYKSLIDSVYSVEEFHKLNNLQINYENALKEKEKQALQRENEINCLKIKKKKIINGLAFFIVIQALLFSVIIYRKYKIIKNSSDELRHQQQLIFEQEKEIERRQNEKIKQNLEYKKRELAVKVFQIFQGNQLNQQLLTKLQGLKYKIKTKGKQGEEIRDDIQRMVNDLKFNSNVQIWDEFEIYFNKVTPGFKNWLVNTYPNLTDNEVRLCFFSQLNLKTKEISNITFQSQRSINVARARLRKKLEIDDHNILVSSFLLSKFTEYKKRKESQA